MKRLNAALTIMLGGCATVPSFIDNAVFAPSESRPTIRASLSNEKYTLEFIPYEKYNPIVDTKHIQLDSVVIDVLENGLDVLDNYQREKMNIQDISAFRNFLYKEAEKLGYKEETVKRFNPKQVIDLGNKIIARNVNYAGCSEDHESKTNRKNRLNNYKKDLEGVVNGSYGEEDKKNAMEKLEIVDRIEVAARELYWLESRIAQEPNLVLSTSQDKDPIDVTLMRGDSIVCRKYADVLKGVFFALSIDNPKLRNTYVGPYTSQTITQRIYDINGNPKDIIGRHCWNQIATVSEKYAKIHLDITFNDPTYFDTSGDSEGLDGSHIDWGVLNAQVRRLNHKLSFLPNQSKPVIVESK